MIISASTDYREAARRRLPPFLFHYIDGGAYAEHTLRRNVSDLADVALRQRILRNMSDLTIGTELWGEKLDLPLVLAPVGLTGMYARRGEVQAARAAEALLALGVFAPCIRYPTVPRGMARLRLTVMAAHTREDLDYAADCLERALAAAMAD